MRVRYAVRARDDLEAILRYVDGQSQAGSRSVRRAVRQSVSLIARHPGLGMSSGESGTRVLPVGRYPYLIYWSVSKGFVTILHIRHAQRERPDSVEGDG